MTRDALMARWSEVGDKIVRLAEEFPDDRYDARPAPGMRTFAEQLRHVAFWNEYAGRTLRGEPADADANELPPDAYATKPLIVDALRRSFGDVGDVLARGGSTPDAARQETVVSFLEHGGEHYGQLVVYARLAGRVPPASR